MAAEEAQELTELVVLLPTLTPQYTHETITQMWSNLWLAYCLALISPWGDRGEFNSWYRE